MKDLITALLLVATLSSAAPAAAEEYTRFLIPVAVRNLPGAFGSQWTSDTWFQYTGTGEAQMTPIPFCFGIQCPDGITLEAGWPPFRFERTFQGEFAFLAHVDRASAGEMQFVSRIRDVSRSDVSAGTAVPVIREDAMAAGTLRLLNVPTDARFRNTLRVYALPDVPEAEVELRYYRLPVFGGTELDYSIVLLRTERLRLHESSHNAFRRALGEPVLFPFIGQIAGFESFPELASAGAIWIEVVPITPGLRSWAMVSITNNETQQVTLVTPDL